MTGSRALSADALRLCDPSVDLAPSYVAFLDEIAAAGERVWPARPASGEALAAFVARIAGGVAPPDPAKVPQTTYWATLGDTVVGHLGLRHRLDAELAEFGGHVGYTVRPSHRGQGLATQMLRQVLRTAKAREIGRLLLTCAPDNEASSRAIRANGGVLERTLFVERVGRQTCLYWITIDGEEA